MTTEKKPKWLGFFTSLLMLFIFVIGEFHHDHGEKSPHHEIHEKINTPKRRKRKW